MAGVPEPPAELSLSGRRLWSKVQAQYELEEHERGLLLEMCRTVDTLDRLAVLVAAEGDMVDGRMHGRMHPALVEARQLRIAYARLAGALRLPAGDEEDRQQGARRPQRRVGVRGVYGIRGTVS